jgi:hypothetical protein
MNKNKIDASKNSEFFGFNGKYGQASGVIVTDRRSTFALSVLTSFMILPLARKRL